MSELLSSIIGGGGSFTTSFATGTIVIASGATGTIATITPPPGEKVKLTGLASGGALQTSLTTLTVGGADVVTDVVLGQPNLSTGANTYMISFENSNQDAITGEINQVFEIKTNVATSQSTVYTYQFGV